MNNLQQIFRDHYEELIYTKKLRQTELDNISRFVDCGDPTASGAMYVCPDCDAQKFVPFRCHSRFCPSCGTLYSRKAFQDGPLLGSLCQASSAGKAFYSRHLRGETRLFPFS